MCHCLPACLRCLQGSVGPKRSAAGPPSARQSQAVALIAASVDSSAAPIGRSPAVRHEGAQKQQRLSPRTADRPPLSSAGLPANCRFEIGIQVIKYWRKLSKMAKLPLKVAAKFIWGGYIAEDSKGVEVSAVRQAAGNMPPRQTCRRLGREYVTFVILFESSCGCFSADLHRKRTTTFVLARRL